MCRERLKEYASQKKTHVENGEFNSVSYSHIKQPKVQTNHYRGVDGSASGGDASSTRH